MPSASPLTATDSVVVRELVPDQSPVIRRVMQAAFAQYTTPDFSYGTERETDASIREELETTERGLAVFVGGEPAAVVKFHVEENTGLLYFWRLGVLPAFRGRALSDRLLDRLMAIAREQGLAGLACNVVPRHRSLAAVYERHGMRVVGEVPFSLPDGSSLPLLRLEGPVAPGPEVRELGPEDADLLRAVMHEAFAEYREKDAPSGALLETAESLRDELAGPARALAAFADGRAVAATKLTVSRDRALVFSRLSVVPDQRGRGHARLLVEAAADEARRLGLRAVGCTVRADETGNIALYGRLGLEVTGRGVHRSLTGRVLDVVQMRRRVGSPASAPSPRSARPAARTGPTP